MGNTSGSAGGGSACEITGYGREAEGDALVGAWMIQKRGEQVGKEGCPTLLRLNDRDDFRCLDGTVGCSGNDGEGAVTRT